eukprot:scpid107221/ scgid34102/ 
MKNFRCISHRSTLAVPMITLFAESRSILTAILVLRTMQSLPACDLEAGQVQEDRSPEEFDLKPVILAGKLRSSQQLFYQPEWVKCNADVVEFYDMIAISWPLCRDYKNENSVFCGRT